MKIAKRERLSRRKKEELRKAGDKTGDRLCIGFILFIVLITLVVIILAAFDYKF